MKTCSSLVKIISYGENNFMQNKFNNNNIILLKQDYKVQLANNKIQMAWLTCWLVVG